jgi:hypothetical protein
VVSDTRTFHDNPTLAQTWPQPASPTWPQATPTKGDASVVRQAANYTGGAFTYQTKTATVYDSYGRATSSPANLVYSYAVSSSAPTVVTIQQLNDESGYITSTTLYDALLRPRQTQDPTPQGEILVSDHLYDSRGWPSNILRNHLSRSCPALLRNRLNNPPCVGRFGC